MIITVNLNLLKHPNTVQKHDLNMCSPWHKEAGQDKFKNRFDIQWINKPTISNALLNKSKIWWFTFLKTVCPSVTDYHGIPLGARKWFIIVFITGKFPTGMRKTIHSLCASRKSFFLLNEFSWQTFCNVVWVIWEKKKDLV